MILRRIAEAFRRQDWFTVCVEVLIVVLGVFIGLQVNDWNQDRKDRIEERQYLERLQKDVARDLEVLAFSRSLADNRIEQIDFIESVAADPERARAEPGRFIVYLEVAAWASYLPIGPRTFEELQSSGRTTLIQDSELRDTLAEYYREIDRWEVILEGETARYEFSHATSGLLTSEHLVLIETATGSDIELPNNGPQVAFEIASRFAATPEATRWLPQMLHYHVLVQEVIGRHEVSAKTMQERLNKALN